MACSKVVTSSTWRLGSVHAHPSGFASPKRAPAPYNRRQPVEFWSEQWQFRVRSMSYTKLRNSASPPAESRRLDRDTEMF